MIDKEFPVPGGSLFYRIMEKKDGSRVAVITGLSGMTVSLAVPDKLEGCPVTEISRKAFLSKKQLRRVALPAGLQKIDDWAFAYCSQLEEVILPVGELALGRSIFLECNALKRLFVPGNREKKISPQGGNFFAEEGNFCLEGASPCPEDGNLCLKEGDSYSKGEELYLEGASPFLTAEEMLSENPSAVPELLAAAVTFFEAYYLLDPVHVGDAEWLAKWDNRMFAYLHADDQEGYAKQVLCGEEDYGSTDLDAFLNNKRKSKVRLAYIRLLNPLRLFAPAYEELCEYLRGHTKGCPSEEAWEVVLEEHGDDPEYFHLFVEISCLTEENFEAVLDDIGEDHTEMKAYFLKTRQEKPDCEDFFDLFKIDW